MSISCYVCGHDKKMTVFQYPKSPKHVCEDCFATLTEDHIIYKSSHPKFDSPALHSKYTIQLMKKKSLEELFTNSLYEKMEKIEFVKRVMA